MEMQLAFIRRCSKLQFSQECLVMWLEKRKKSLEENFGKDLLELPVYTFQKVLVFLLLCIQNEVFKEICIKKRLK